MSTRKPLRIVVSACLMAVLIAALFSTGDAQSESGYNGYTGYGGYGASALPGAAGHPSMYAPSASTMNGAYPAAGTYGTAAGYAAPGQFGNPAQPAYSGAGFGYAASAAPSGAMLSAPGAATSGYVGAVPGGSSFPQGGAPGVPSNAAAGFAGNSQIGAGSIANGSTGAGTLGGQGASVANALSGLNGAASGASIGEIAQRLGIGPAQLQALENKVAAGTLTPDDIQQLCMRLAASNITPTDAESMARSLGFSLTDSQISQLKSCTQLGQSQQSMPGMRQQNGIQNLALSQSSPQATPVPPGVSSIEQTFQALDSGQPLQPPTSQALTQFGYALFSSPVSTFAPVDNVPVGKDYVVGPGDELRVLIWGRVTDNIDQPVQRDGSYLIPEVGPLQVAGLTFDQTKKLIEERLAQISGAHAHVTMGQLRTIQVFVLGEVTQPGAYTISALARVSNALAAAGGITKMGSMRMVELRRSNQTIRTIDLYDLLLTGHTGANLQLEAGDVVFVPVIGPVAGVSGDMRRPAIYELSSASAPLPKVLKLAGGISAFAYSHRVQVERIQDHVRRIALDVNLNDQKARHFEIRDGDLVRVYTVLPDQKNIVVAEGNVYRPGNYQWREGMHVSALVREAEGVMPQTFFRYALLKRLVGDDKTTRIISVDLGEALSAKRSNRADIELKPQDDLTIFNESQIRDLPTVQANGEVRNPGMYVLERGMRVSDLVYLAGGLREDAYQNSAELVRTQVSDGNHTQHLKMEVNLKESLNGSDAANPVLMPNDELFVQVASNWHLPWVVKIDGRVMRPGSYSIHPGERLSSLINRCGGLLPDAYAPATVFTRHSVQVIEQKRLDQAKTELQQAIAQLAMMPTQPGEDKNSHSAEALAMMQQVLIKNESQQADGRLVVHLRPLAQLENSADNVELEDQDFVEVPKRPSGVLVLGQVYSPNSIVYEPHLRVRDYLQKAGGPNQGADPEHIMVIKADGAVVTNDGVKDSEENRVFPLLPLIQGGLMDQTLQPGDTVYVPQQLVFVSKIDYVKAITTIISNSAMSLAVLGLLGTKL